MKIRIALLISLTFAVFAGFSQTTQLNIEGTGGKFYLKHAVVAKENWYSIGRLFNQSPKDIASFNNLNFDKPLEIGQEVNIPLTTVNFDQKQLKTTGESLIPIYHQVGEGEWIYKISSIYNDVPVSSLEKWNKIKKDDVKKGTTLIVGYLKVKTDQSPLAMGIASNPVITSTPPVTATTSAATVTTTPPKPVTQTVSTTTTTPTPVIPVSNTSEKVNNYAATHSNGGFFSSDYAGGGKSASGTAGTFKSTSGWTDGKYYALMNNVAVGTIIRVTASNGKTIYAKVLGQLPEMKESNGLALRISNAASAELGLGEGKFAVEIKY